MSLHTGLRLKGRPSPKFNDGGIITYDGYPPRVQWQVWRCMKCRARFEVPSLVNIELSMAVKFMRAARCPACNAGAARLSVMEGRTLAEDRADRPKRWEAEVPNISERLGWWWSKGDTGSSSKTIVNRMTGTPQVEQLNDCPDDCDDLRRREHPHHCGDLRRCLLLLDLVPEWRDNISKMASRSETWARLAARWSDLTASYLAESPNLDGPTPKTAALLEQLSAEPTP